MIVCDKCSAEFSVKSVNIDECSEGVNGKKFILKYFTCPVCMEKYIILFAEEHEYKKLLDDLNSVLNRMEKANGKENVVLLEKLQKMAARKRKRLQSYIKSMNKKYKETFTFKSS